MPRARCPERDLAYQLWISSGKTKKLKDIAAELNVSEEQVRKWKSQDKWNGNVTVHLYSNVTKRKRGGQPGNKNGKGSPKGNRRAEKYGFMSKYLPDETKEIFDAIASADPLDLLWHQIQIQYAAIIRAQQIAFVKDKFDLSSEIQAEGSESTSYAIQYAWEKQENFLNAQSRAMSTLMSMLKRYDEALHERGSLTREEQKLRVEKLQAEIDRLRNGSDADDDQVLQFIEGMKHDKPDTEAD